MLASSFASTLRTESTYVMGVQMRFEKIEEYQVVLPFPASIPDRRVGDRHFIDAVFNGNDGPVPCKIVKLPRPGELSELKCKEVMLYVFKDHASDIIDIDPGP